MNIKRVPSRVRLKLKKIKLNFHFFKRLPAHEKRITLSTLFTASRILVTPFIVGAMITGHWDIAFLIFLYAALTDMVDGTLARYRNEQTFLGACLDPIADKLLILSVFATLACVSTPLFGIPLWFLLLVLLKEMLLVGGAIALYAIKGHVEVRPTLLGKLTTVVQICFILWLFACYFFEWMPVKTYYTMLGNVLKFLGHKATKEFYINDAGAQMKKLGMSLKIRVLQALGEPAELSEDAYHGEYMKDLATAYLADYGTQALEQPDEIFSQYAEKELLHRIKETLKNYGIHFDTWFSEKSLHESGQIARALDKLNAAGHLYESDGALWFRSTAFGDDKDRVVRKASGELTYVAADIAYMQNKIDRGADHLVMILGHDHHSYVTRLHGLAQALGLGNYPFDIILYQLVKIKASGELVRMSKRAGNIVTLDDVIETVGKDVARFFYLYRKADAQLEFDIDLALKKTEENPVYYIQYAYVRTKSILENAEKHQSLHRISAADCDNLGNEERLLLKKIIYLKTLLDEIASNHQTHLLAYYTHELAQAFAKYYSKHRVLDAQTVPLSRARLALVTMLRTTFSTTLDLMGISKPERM